MTEFNSFFDNKKQLLVDEAKLLKTLEVLTAQMKDDCHRSTLEKTYPGMFQNLEVVLNACIKPEVKVECYRLLRNSMAFPANQDSLRNNTTIINHTLAILKDPEQSSSTSDLHRVCFQFLTNSIIGNETNAGLVQEEAKYFLDKYLGTNLMEVGIFTNTLLRVRPEFASNVTPTMFNSFLRSDAPEAFLLCLETLSANSDFLRMTYHEITSEQRVNLLNFLMASPCKKSLSFFVEIFLLKTDAILKSDLVRIEDEFAEILYMTALVSSFNDLNEIEYLQGQGALVTTAIHLLKMANSSQAFESREKLSQITEEEQCHPTFMFKANLIRLLGNLAYRNNTNQLLIGQQCLDTLLNCTKIDALNPFITQWSILTIRNLLEGNTDNQNVVRSLTLNGSAYSSVLGEFGIQVTLNEQGKPRISKTEQK